MGRYVSRPSWLTDELIEFNHWIEARLIECFELGKVDTGLMFDPDLLQADIQPQTFITTIGLLAYLAIHFEDARRTQADDHLVQIYFLEQLRKRRVAGLTEILDSQQMSVLRSVLDFLTFAERPSYRDYLLDIGEWLTVRPALPKVH